MDISTYRETTPLDNRKDLAEKVRLRYPGRIPIICEAHDATDKTAQLDKRKFLCPSGLLMGQFVMTIRQRMKDFKKSDAIYLYVGPKGVIPSNIMTVAEAHEKYAEEDGLLYIKFAKENTFG